MFDNELLKLKGAKRAIVICSIFALARSACILAQALSLSGAICGLWYGDAISIVCGFLILFSASFIAKEALVNRQEAYMDSFARKRVLQIQESYLERIFEAGRASISKIGAPAATALAIEGSEDIFSYIKIAIPNMVSCIVIPIVLLAGLFALDIISAIIALVLLPFMIIYMRLIGMTAKESADKRHDQFMSLSNSFVNKARGIVDLKAFDADGRFAKVIYDSSEAFRKITMKTLKVSMLSSAVLDLFATLALAAVAIMLGFRMVEGSLEFFPALAVLVIVPEYFKPIKEFGGNYHETLNGKESMDAMAEFLGDAQSSIAAGLEHGSHDSSKPSVPNSHFWASSLKQDGSFELDTSASRKIAIMGKSGCGKTTFLNALAGLSVPPCDFKFVIDGTSTDDLMNDEWRARVAYIPQEPHIFAASIRDNIAFYKPDASDDEISSALEAVGMTEVVNRFSEGLNAPIGDGGHALSGGELARIAICRALLDPARDVWIVDEPSARLDARTEEMLIESLMKLSRGKTAIFVTHSNKWASCMDDIVAIENIEEGGQG